MSIAAAKRRRRQVVKGNRHLAKIGRPGVPKKISAEQGARRLAHQLIRLKEMQQRRARKS